MCRNPWGYGEWQLKWSENPDYTDKVKSYEEEIKKYFDNEKAIALKNGDYPPEVYNIGVEDGTFLICFKDWRTVYTNLFICFKFT